VEKQITTALIDGQVMVNGQVFENPAYLAFHQPRIAYTMQKLHHIGAKRIVEIGAHPWMMSAALIDDPEFALCATVSAEEVTNWPDDIGVTTQPYHIRTGQGNETHIVNYAANIERTRFDLQEKPDTVVACEIVEHLIRSPHVMFLNINRWLPVAGKLLVTTPNGAQFANPWRRKSPMPAYRCHIYERHAFLYTLDELTELIALCGFRIVEAGYWDVYERHGWSTIYKLLSHLPWRYCRDKFMRTIFVVAEKVQDVAILDRVPRVCDPHGDWEWIKHGNRDRAYSS
jgi:hypothetical protein